MFSYKFYRKYCREHLCKYKECDEINIRGNKYCKNHLCKFENCKESVKFNFHSDGTYCSYCTDHLCSLTSCQNKRTYNSDRCTQHIDMCRYRTYDTIICNNKLDGKLFYCSKHSCPREKNCINNIECHIHRCAKCNITKNSCFLYCQNHKSETFECNNQKYIDSKCKECSFSGSEIKIVI